MEQIVLYGCWRSSASHRLQIALRLKGLDFDYRPVDLDRGEQHSPWFRAINPRGELPVLIVNGETWFQSLSILEALEECYPQQGLALLPHDPRQKRLCRELAEAINSSLQPLLLPARLRQPILQAAAAERRTEIEEALRNGVRSYQLEALGQLERWLRPLPGPFCLGDSPTLADVLLVPQLEAAMRLGIDINGFRRLSDLHSACRSLEAFAAAAPERQSDAPIEDRQQLAVRQELLAHKDPSPRVADYLSTVANGPIPGLEACRGQTLEQFGVVASKMTSLDGCLLLRWLCRSRGVRKALEIGVFTGSSSLAILDGLTADGRLMAIDNDPRSTAVAEQCWQAVGRSDQVDLRIGDALEQMPLLTEEFELIYVDGDNHDYGRYLELALPLMAPGGLLVFDNVLWRGRVLEPADDSSAISLDHLIRLLAARADLDCTVLSVSDGLALVQRPQAAGKLAR